MNLEQLDGHKTILLVEDNPGDVRLVQEAFKERQRPNHLLAVKDGQEAMAFLRQDDVYSDAPRPNLILLDLNLPRKSGREVLAEIKGDKEFRYIPVVVLTASHSPDDILQAYDLQANCYIAKPLDLNSFIDVVQSIENYWLKFVKLPPQPHEAMDNV